MTDPLARRMAEFVLASMVTAYPGDELRLTLHDLTPEENFAGLRPLRDASHSLEALQGQYSALFDCGGHTVPLYETAYGRMRDVSKCQDLADLGGFYRAFSLDLDVDTHDMLDHASVELEFYASLLLKRSLLAETGDLLGVEVVDSARRKFLKEHLGTYLTVIASHDRVAHHPTYGPALMWCAQRVSAECTEVGVTPDALDHVRAPLPDEHDCAT